MEIRPFPIWHSAMAVAATAVITISATLAEIASFQGLGFLPNRSERSDASAISADGSTVVGTFGSSGAFHWTAPMGMKDLGDLSWGRSNNDVPSVCQVMGQLL